MEAAKMCPHRRDTCLAGGLGLVVAHLGWHGSAYARFCAQRIPWLERARADRTGRRPGLMAPPGGPGPLCAGIWPVLGPHAGAIPIANTLSKGVVENNISRAVL